MFFRSEKLSRLFEELEKAANRQLGGTWTRAQLSFHHGWTVVVDNCHYHNGRGEHHIVLSSGRTPIEAAEEALKELRAIERYSGLRTGEKCNESCEKAQKVVAQIRPSP